MSKLLQKEKNDEEIFYPIGKKVIINKDEFIIMPFVLKNRTKVLKIFVEIFSDFMNLNPQIKKDDINLSNFILDFINIAGERLIEIYKIVLNKDNDWLNNNIQLKHEIEIISAIFELNEIPFLIRQVKQLIEKMNKNQKIT